MVTLDRNGAGRYSHWNHLYQFGNSYPLLERSFSSNNLLSWFMAHDVAKMSSNRRSPVLSVFSHCIILFVSILCLIHVVIIFVSNKTQVMTLAAVVLIVLHLTLNFLAKSKWIYCTPYTVVYFIAKWIEYWKDNPFIVRLIMTFSLIFERIFRLKQRGFLMLAMNFILSVAEVTLNFN